MRRYASFFEWHDRRRAELGVVEELIQELERRDERRFSAARSFERDPPDCNCENESGGLVAVEVTEIVCAEAARLTAKGHHVYREWQPGELAGYVKSRLAEKDAKVYYGGPCHETIVCLFSAEPMLTIGCVRAELDGVSFGPFQRITGAYLLFSYDPSTKTYPVLTLTIHDARPRETPLK